MSEPTIAKRHPQWFQYSLRTLLILMLVVAAYFAGFSTARKLAEKEMQEAQQNAAAELEAAQQAAIQARMNDEQQTAALRLFLKGYNNGQQPQLAPQPAH